MIKIDSYQEALGHGVDICTGILFFSVFNNPEIAELSEKYPQIDIYHIDAVNCHELVSAFGVKELPTLIVLAEGERVKTIQVRELEQEILNLMRRA